MFSITTKLKSTYAQITLNRVTVAFFFFSFIHCFSQGILQSFLFSIDSQFAGLVRDIVHAAEIPPNNITFLEGSSHRYTLRMCNNIPHGQSLYPCTVIFQSGVDDVRTGSGIADFAASESDSVFQDFSQGFAITTYHDADGNASGVKFQSSTADPVLLSKQCTQILVYPQQVLENSVREDMTFIFLQFWLFGVSVFAVAQSSVPHLLTALGTRVLITTWSTYITSFRGHNQETIFQQLVSAPGTPCGVELFPTFFGMRQAYDIADLVLSWSALLLSALLSWNLLKLYNAESFKHVGPPEHINRIYKFFMAVQACLQMEVFVLVTATSLWVDVLANTAISKISAHTTVYDALIIATTVLVLPWIALGWYGVRREQKGLMISFLAIAFFFIAGWGIMFYSIVYRWSFVQWPYLGCFTVASFVLIIASIVLGTICWRNFGKGLAEYLNAEAALADSNFAPEIFKHSDIEKSAAFYTYDEPDRPMPTFQAPPSQQHSRNTSMTNDGARVVLRGPPPAYDRTTIVPF